MAKQSKSFNSIQILSSKAHALWTKAKAANEEQSKAAPQPEQSEPEQNGPDLIVGIQLASVVKAALAIFAIYIAGTVLFLLIDKLIVLLLAFFLSMVIDASVRSLERMKIPRSISVLIVFVVFLSIAIFLVASLIPIVATQIQDLAKFINSRADQFLAEPRITVPIFSIGLNEQLTVIMKELLQSFDIQTRADALGQFGANLSSAAQTSVYFVVQLAGSVFNFLVNFVLILFLTFFIQMEKEKITDFIRFFFPRYLRNYFDTKAEAVYRKMSQWTQGQLILCLSVGVLIFIALEVLGMPYALTLALLAGFTEFIPVMGPLIAAVPAVLIAMTQFGFMFGFIVAIVYYVVQLCENHILVPLIMKHAVGLSPIVIMFGMLVGVSFPDTINPILGVILAVPISTIIAIFIEDLQQFSRKKRPN